MLGVRLSNAPRTPISREMTSERPTTLAPGGSPATDGKAAASAVLRVAIDRVTAVENGLDRDAGEDLLSHVERRLEGAMRPGGTLERLCCKGFVVFTGEPIGERQGLAAGRCLLETLRSPFMVGGRRLRVTASIGLAFVDAEARDSHSAVGDAQLALRRAQSRGGDRVEIYDDEMRRSARERVEMEEDLRHALARDELVLYFQPVASLTGPDVSGVEALVRWKHPRRGLVPPSEFIPVAEDSGLVVGLGRWILAEACGHLARWSTDPAITVPYVSVNLSGRQLAEHGLPELVAEVLEETGAPADRLVVELTEAVLMKETASPAAVLQRLREIGVRIFLDDFGAGHSSLRDLKHFPIDALKIDPSLIVDIADRGEDRHIIAGILMMARGLAVDVIAKGVETVEQAKSLRALGCELAQGYLIGRPAPAVVVETFLASSGSLEWLSPEARASAADALYAASLETAGAALAREERTVSLGDAARALGVSVSTLRRWADAGRVASVRTNGGHRRFAVSEIRRLQATARPRAAPVVRTPPMPLEALTGVERMLPDGWQGVARMSARALYEGARIGWFASDSARRPVAEWADAVAAACRAADYAGAVEATRGLLREAHCGGAALLERHTFLERCGDIATRGLHERGARREELVGTRRLFLGLRHAVLADVPPGA